MKCQGHAISITSKATTVINIDAKPDKSLQQRARNDPEVAASLKSFGISKVEDYVYQDGKKVKKFVSYEMTVSDVKKVKNMIKKFAQILPGLIDDDDEKVIDKVIDDVLKTQKQKTQTQYFQFTERPVTERNVTQRSVIEGTVTKRTVTTTNPVNTTDPVNTINLTITTNPVYTTNPINTTNPVTPAVHLAPAFRLPNKIINRDYAADLQPKHSNGYIIPNQLHDALTNRYRFLQLQFDFLEVNFIYTHGK